MHVGSPVAEYGYYLGLQSKGRVLIGLWEYLFLGQNTPMSLLICTISLYVHAYLRN